MSLICVFYNASLIKTKVFLQSDKACRIINFTKNYSCTKPKEKYNVMSPKDKRLPKLIQPVDFQSFNLLSFRINQDPKGT